MGGGFGSKLNTQQVHGGRGAAGAQDRPAGEATSSAGKRPSCAWATAPPTSMKLKAGVKKDGTLTALELTGAGEVGAYPAAALGGPHDRASCTSAPT